MKANMFLNRLASHWWHVQKAPLRLEVIDHETPHPVQPLPHVLSMIDACSTSDLLTQEFTLGVRGRGGGKPCSVREASME